MGEQEGNWHRETRLRQRKEIGVKGIWASRQKT
jgi:hypothetical protein